MVQPTRAVDQVERRLPGRRLGSEESDPLIGRHGGEPVVPPDARASRGNGHRAARHRSGASIRRPTARSTASHRGRSAARARRPCRSRAGSSARGPRASRPGGSRRGADPPRRRFPRPRLRSGGGGLDSPASSVGVPADRLAPGHIGGGCPRANRRLSRRRGRVPWEQQVKGRASDSSRLPRTGEAEIRGDIESVSSRVRSLRPG
jgi:hypothetical protein